MYYTAYLCKQLCLEKKKSIKTCVAYFFHALLNQMQDLAKMKVLNTGADGSNTALDPHLLPE